MGWLGGERRFPAPGEALIAAGLALVLAVMPAAFDPRLYDDFTLSKQATLLVSAALVVAGLAWDGKASPSSRAVRVAVAAWVGMLVLAWALGIDRRGSVLGYYQYRQGLLTQLSYVVVFLGAFHLARLRKDAWLRPAGFVGFGAVLAYTAVQALGRDPVEWWIDTSVRAIGTIGNANELAAYAVIALGPGGGLSARRRGTWWLAGLAGGVSFIIFEAESRSGLLALAAAIALYPVAALVQDLRRTTAARHFAALAGGTIAGLVLSVLAGSAAETAGRVASGVAQQDSGGSTRLALWEGTIETVKASPFVGFGPDGLFLAFPRHRPADLGGAFDDYDLVVQSSHNWLLDTAANTGIPGLAALLGLLVVVALRTIQHERGQHDEGIALAWSAMAAYCGLTLLNPLSLAAHALFWVMLGVLAGRTEAATSPLATVRRGADSLKTWKRFAGSVVRFAAAPVAAGLVLVAVMLPVSDREADRAWGAFAAGDFRKSAELYGDASALMPFERGYAEREAEAWLAAGVGRHVDALERAEAALWEFDEEFGFAGGDALSLAAAEIGLGREQAEVLEAVDRALTLNPHGVAMAKYTETLRAAASNGGVLRYSTKDRWVYVEVPAAKVD